MVTGLAASSGVAEGLVRVLRFPEDAALFRPGEVLVVACAESVGHRLFVAASAVVTDSADRSRMRRSRCGVRRTCGGEREERDARACGR